MKNERLMALTFIVVGCIGAVALGFVVWQASSPSRPTLDIAMRTTTTTTPTPALYEEPGEEDFSEGDVEPAKQNLAAVDTEDPYLAPNAYVPSRTRVEPASPALTLSAQDQVNTSVTGTGSPTGTASGTTSVIPSSGTTPPTTPETPESMTRTPEPPTPPSPPRDPVAPTQPSPTPTTTTEESEDVTTPTVPVITTTPTVIPPAPTETVTPTDTATATATATDTVDPPVESPTPTEFQDEPTVPLNPETPVG